LWLRYVEARLHVRAQFFERTVLLAHRQIVRHRCRALIEAALWHRRPHAHQPSRIRIGRRCEQHSLDQTEQGRVCADSQSERDHGSEYEARVLPELAPGIAKISGQVFHMTTIDDHNSLTDGSGLTFLGRLRWATKPGIPDAFFTRKRHDAI